MSQPSPRLSLLVTVLAWLAILVSALLLPISVITLLMLVAKSYGADSADLAGFFSVVVAPPATLVAGIGLLRRWRWARYYMLVLLAILIALNASHLARGNATPSTSASGVLTTTMHCGGPSLYSLPIIGLCGAALILLIMPSVRREFAAPRNLPAIQVGPPPSPASPERGWRVGHQGRDGMYYEELQDGAWQRIEIQGEMLIGRAHHVIYFFPPDRWQGYPGWARHRREEIIRRIKSEFREPDYEYYGDGATTPQLPTTQPSAAPRRPAGPAATARQWASLVAAIVILLCIAGGAGLMVKGGLESGLTYLPLKRPSLQRVVSRAAEPATFWLAIGVYAIVGVAAASGAIWFCREARHLSRR